jgi:ABC-type Fe3+-hydroxamate transport system substrate-binding protein
MTISRDTFVDSVIRNSGGRNIFEDSSDRYPLFTLGDVAALQPEVILLPTEPYHFTKRDLADFEALGVDVPAIRNRRVHIVEGELLSWYGPRLSRALGTISQLLRS